MGQAYQLESSIEHNIYLLAPIVQFPFFNATADDMPSKTEKSGFTFF